MPNTPARLTLCSGAAWTIRQTDERRFIWAEMCFHETDLHVTPFSYVRGKKVQNCKFHQWHMLQYYKINWEQCVERMSSDRVLLNNAFRRTEIFCVIMPVTEQ
jgi:intergrase/recombinase